MRSVLIAGCGYLGQATADLFQNAGWTVEGWTRSAESAAQLSRKPFPVRSVDISKAEEVAAAKAADFHAIIHCASTGGGDADLYRQVYWQGAQNLLQRFAGSQILFVSSTSVYAQQDAGLVTEESPAVPEHETGKVLRETEQLVLESGGVVARLAGIYGPGRSALLKRFMKGEAFIDPENERFVNQVHRDDAASALLLLLKGPWRSGEIYNVVDDDPIRQSDCYRWLAGQLNKPIPPTGKASSERKRGRSNKRVSNAKLRALGWEPRYPTFAKGVEKSVLPGMADSPL